MPRKGGLQQFYEDEYDYYDEEEDYADYGADSSSSGVNEGNTTGARVWACPICTYDNSDELRACDMCGVLRNSPAPVHPSDSVPFKFDEPSPDDMVLGVQTSRKTKQGGELKKPQMKDVTEKMKKSLTLEEESPQMKKKSSTRTDEVSHQAKKSVITTNDEILHEVKNKADEVSHQAKEVSHPSKHKGLPLESYKPEPWMLQGTKGQEKNVLHLVVVGHVDAGKSTLMGRILHTLGRISQKEMHKNQKDANEMGKGSFAYAWALDEGAEERARGVTITVALAHFETKKLHIVLLDAPGHKDFVPNMISGASQADAAVLVVDASEGGFEAGMGEGREAGQTREHAQLIRSLGVNQLIVAVNKMDVVEYSKERYEGIKQNLSPFLRHCGFKDSNISWVPVSAISGENLVSSPTIESFKAWYKGYTLLDVLDGLEAPARDVTRPFRMAIAEVVKTRSLAAAAAGKIETGAVKIGSKIMVMPCREVAIIKSIEQDGTFRQVARAGDSVEIGLQGVDSFVLVPGGVLCHPDYLVPVATRIEIRILTLKLFMPILPGAQVVLHAHHAKEPAIVTSLISLLDSKTGQPVKQSPRHLPSNQSALIEVVPERGVCVEEYTKFRALGRVILRSGGQTCAVGIVTRIVSCQ